MLKTTHLCTVSEFDHALIAKARGLLDKHRKSYILIKSDELAYLHAMAGTNRVTRRSWSTVLTAPQLRGLLQLIDKRLVQDVTKQLTL